MNAKLRYILIVVIVIVVGYIAYSTKSINKAEYRTIAWERLSQGSYFREKFQYTWEGAEVKRININREEKEHIAAICGAWGRSNYYLIQLNDGYAVSVIFRISGSNTRRMIMKKVSKLCLIIVAVILLALSVYVKAFNTGERLAERYVKSKGYEIIKTY